MINLEEFHQYFLQSIISEAESRTLLKPQAFFETVCEDLVSIGDLTNNYTYAEYIKKGIEVLGYDFDEERRILTILNHQFFQDDNIQTLTRSNLESKFNRMKNFLRKSFVGIHSQMEETSDAYSMAYNLYTLYEKGNILKVRLMLLTDGRVTRTLTDLPRESFLSFPMEFRVIDLEYLYKIYSTANGTGDFEVKVDLPYLAINQENNNYKSYLTVISGNALATIYEDFGQKLLEQNVRTFLQFRGAVNKGLRNTIETSPEMFFAYNNGITATASSINIDENNKINLIKNFQIVNGGQTTSAIYSAYKISKIDVSKVFIQMKLSVVIDQNNQDGFVSKVAEYANTQNKINNSDFFSNSPFHRDMKEYSVRIFAPATEGIQRRTHWYYERVRGEYLNNQVYLSTFEKKKFILENPKNQLIDKTLLAKSENSWNQKPDVVSKGAQDSFKKFAENINNILEHDSLGITESYFKDAVSKIIIFRSVEKLITNSSWYDGGFRAQTVTYTISYLSAALEKEKKNLNFSIIWELQTIPDTLLTILSKVAEAVYNKITSPPPGFANISQWTKNQKCWENVKNLEIIFATDDDILFMNNSQISYIKKEDKKKKIFDTDIDKQINVVQTPLKVWKLLNDYYSENKSSLRLTSMQSDILIKIINGNIKIPSEKQSLILFSLKKTAQDEGLNLDF